MKTATYERLFGNKTKLPPLPNGWIEKATKMIEEAEAKSPDAEELVISQIERMLRITKFQLAKKKKPRKRTK